MVATSIPTTPGRRAVGFSGSPSGGGHALLRLLAIWCMRCSLAGMITRMTAGVVVALAVCAGVLAAGCAGGGAVDENGSWGSRSKDALLVAEASGTFRGLRLGDSRAQVQRRIGPARCPDGALIAPIGEDYDDIGIPNLADYQPRDKDGPYEQCVMRYRRLVVTVFLPDGAISLGTTDPQAHTRRGVGIGDSTDLVKERYPGAECQDFQGGGQGLLGNEGTVPAGCVVPPAPGNDGLVPLRLSFGLDKDGEEVSSIWLEATSWAGIKALRRR